LQPALQFTAMRLGFDVASPAVDGVTRFAITVTMENARKKMGSAVTPIDSPSVLAVTSFNIVPLLAKGKIGPNIRSSVESQQAWSAKWALSEPLLDLKIKRRVSLWRFQSQPKVVGMERNV
jgi:hypothetical protein